VKPPADAADPPPVGSALAGIGYALLGAFFYTGANVWVRAIPDGIDPMVVTTLRECPLAFGASLWVLIESLRGTKLRPVRAALITLVVGASVNQFLGNTLFITGLSVLGLALSVPIVLGVLIFSGALIGRVALGEPVNRLVLMAMLVLVGAIALLGWATRIAQQRATAENAPAMVAVAGEDAASDSDRTPDDTPGDATVGGLLTKDSPWRIPLGFAAVVAAGVSFAGFGVCVRHASNLGTQTPVTMMIVGVAGTIAILTVVLIRLGPGELWSVDRAVAGKGLAAGVCNLAAFFFITRAFQRIPVVFVNGINSSQCAMATVAGVVIFSEPTSAPLYAGIALTVCGLVLMGIARTAQEKSDRRLAEA
jgi:drug/metabolite transporter (DMT)-like permease